MGGIDPLQRPAVHATAVVWNGLGLLIRGPSGSGKSSLAHALLDRAELTGRLAVFVADDRVHLAVADGRLIAHAPPAIAGQAELRGRGIVAVPFVPQAEIHLVADFVDPAAMSRMPEPEELVCRLEGVVLPRQPLPAGRIEAALRLTLAALRDIAVPGAR